MANYKTETRYVYVGSLSYEQFGVGDIQLNRLHHKYKRGVSLYHVFINRDFCRLVLL